MFNISILNINVNLTHSNSEHDLKSKWKYKGNNLVALVNQTPRSDYLT